MSAAPAHDELLGRALGDYVLRERIGEGGFGAVYRASQRSLDREVVVKVLHTRLSSAPVATERFLREAKLASKLDHPYAAHIYAFGAEPDGELWIAMEIVRGTPLDKLLAAQGPIPLERFVPLVDRICEVVHTAHEQGIIHRDIKPANVMVLARAGRLLPKLLDLGIAKGLATGAPSPATSATVELAPRADDSDGFASTYESGEVDPAPDGVAALTRAGAIIGSPHYMAPEQWQDAGEVTSRTDLYALGVLAYECLTGTKPFNGQTLTQIAYAHAQQQPPPLDARFPAALDAVLAKAMAKSVTARYATALEFAAAFREAAGLTGDAAPLPGIDPVRRDAATGFAPQPIAEAVAALDAARNAHQARDAIVMLARTVVRFLALVAVACRSRVAPGPEAPEIADGLRALHRGTLSEARWLELAAAVVRGWSDRKDAFPVPELVDTLADARLVADLEALTTLRDRAAPSEVALRATLDDAIPRVTRVLDAIAFLADYPLVVTVTTGVAERWTGVRRTRRTTTAVHGKGLGAGVAALLDLEGAPVVSLAPLVHVAAPTPGAPLELFMFDGRDSRGAKLVALPAGFEHHDDDVWQWFRAQLVATLDDTGVAIDAETSPYRGLSAFSADDNALFFGREKAVDAFVNRLKLVPLLAVVGRSGAGKSSFVHAGVVPALGWKAIAMRPGVSPLGALAARLEHAGVGNEVAPTASGRMATPVPYGRDLRDTIASDRNSLGALLRGHALAHGPVVLVVDQLEELFTLCQDADERGAFAEAIAAAARAPEDGVRVIVTLRDDFLVRAEQVPALRNRLGQGVQLLTVPGADELQRIVCEPARRAGYEFDDPALPREMVADVADQPGALALISFTAAKLWELRDRQFKQLTRAAYRSLGGVGGALAHHAERTLDGMLPEERALTRQAFRHLVTAQNTRAVLTRKELRELLAADHADAVIEKLVAARLLVASENEANAETIEIIHEALLAAWPRLVQWRREDAEGAHFREQLRAAAKQWEERGRTKGLLWRGEALVDYTRWRTRHAGPLTDIERAFAEASLGDAARGRRLRRGLVIAAFAIAAVVVVVLVWANHSTAQARSRADERLVDLRVEQGRQALLNKDPMHALVFLDRAYADGASGGDLEFLVGRATAALANQRHVLDHDGPLNTLEVSPDGKLVATAAGNEARLWDPDTGKLVRTLRHAQRVWGATFSADGRLVATNSSDKTVKLWDVTTGEMMRELVHPEDLRTAARFSADGRRIATVATDNIVRVWDTATGAAVATLTGHTDYVYGVMFLADGRLLSWSDDGTARIWDVATGHALQLAHAKSVVEARLSPDQRLVATASLDGTVGLWDASTGVATRTLRHLDAVNSVVFSADGSKLATTSEDRRATIWDTRTGDPVVTLLGHTAQVVGVRFSPDGGSVLTFGADGTARLWDASSGAELAIYFGHSEMIIAGEFLPSGDRIVTASYDKTARVWDVPREAMRSSLAGRPGELIGLGFNYQGFAPVASGDRLLIASTTGAPTIRSLHDGSVIGELAPTERAGRTAFWSPDAVHIAVLADDGVELRAIHGSGVTLTGTNKAALVAFSADGRLLAIAYADRAAEIWDAGSRARLAVLDGTASPVWSMTFAPDGSRIAIGGPHLAGIWDARGGGAIAALVGHSTGVVDVAWSSDGARLVTAGGNDKTARIWDRDGRPRVVLQGHAGNVSSATFDATGAFVVTASEDSTVRVWSARTGLLLYTYELQLPPGWAGFSADGRSILAASRPPAAGADTPPSYRLLSSARDTRSPSELAALVRCRVPFALDNDQVVPHATTCD